MQLSSINLDPQKKIQKPLFTLMHETLELAKKLTLKNIFLIGQSRSGKSTTFNWINDHRTLVGTRELFPVYIIRRQLNDREQRFAQVKKGYKSVTLIPNIISLPSGQTLIDMPGNCDERTEVHVLMVSFIYRVLLKHTKNAKFIILITNQGFTAPDSAKIKGLVSLFIKLFQCKEMNDLQLQQLFKSVSLLVTGVPVQRGQQRQMKRYYCQLLSEKLQSLRQIRQTNQIAEIFPYIQIMLQDIIRNQRLELFVRAKPAQSPQPCTILHRFNQHGWQYCSISNIQPYLRFPYTQQFNKLKPDQQQNLQTMQSTNIKQYLELQQLLAQFVKIFLNKPIQYTYFCDEYLDVYEQLIKFYLEVLIQSDQERSQQTQSIEKLNEDTTQGNCSPIQNLKNVLRLMQISSDILLPSQFQPNQLITNYFEYLSQFFSQSLQLIIKSFALSQKSKYVLNQINKIMSERIQYFRYISQLQNFKYSAFHMDLMDYIKIMNVFSYRDFEVIDQFFKNANQQEKLQLPLDHIMQVINFLKDQKLQLLDLSCFYEISYKMLELGAQKYSQKRNHRQSLQYNAFGIISLIKYILATLIKLQNEGNKQNISEKVEQINRKLKQIFYKLSVNLLQIAENKYTQFQQLFLAVQIQSHLKNIYEKYLNQRGGQPVSVAFLKKYLQYCEKHSLHKKAQQICKLISTHKLASKQEKQYYRQKKRDFQRLSIPAYHQKQTQIKLQNYLNIANKILEKYLKIPTQNLSIESITMFISQKILIKKNKNQIASQFTIQLPETLTNYDIIFYSNYLISKIKNRKTIILLGNKTGKSTVSYWLRGKELIKNGNSVNVRSENLKESTIKETKTKHTQVPNIYILNNQQLLVDAPHIYNRYQQKIFIIGYILKQILLNSSQTKFILTIKEDDLLNKQCEQLIQMLQSYVKLFKSFKESPQLMRSLYLVVTFIDNNNKLKVRQSLKKILQLFKEEENSQIIIEKYKVQRRGICTKTQILQLLNSIFLKNLYKSFDLQEQKYRKKEPMIEELNHNQHWTYSLVKTKINLVASSLNSFLGMRDSQHKKMFQKIKNLIRTGLDLIVKLHHIFFTIVEFPNHTIKIQNQQKSLCLDLRHILTQQWIGIQEKYQSKDKKFKYSELQRPQIYKQPALSSLQLFLILTKISKLDSILGHYSDYKSVKTHIEQLFRLYMSAVGPFLTNLEMIELSWIKIWEVVTQIEIYHNQTNLPNDDLTQQEQKIKYEYGRIICDSIQICQHLDFSKELNITEICYSFISHFDLPTFRQKSKSISNAHHLLFLALQEITSILKDGLLQTQIRVKRQKTLKQHIKKLSEIQKYFIDSCLEQLKAALVVLQQSNIAIMLHDQLKIINAAQRQDELILTLQTNIEIICDRLATVNIKFSLQICDRLQNDRLKQRVLQNLQKRNMLNKQYLLMFHQLLIRNGDKGRALRLIDSHKQMLGDDYEELKVKSLKKDNQIRDSRIARQLSLVQLKQLIEYCRNNLNS